MAHLQATRLFARVEKDRNTQPDRWRAVAHALSRVVHVHICLLLDTEAQSSPTRASVWRAEQCLKEWDRLSRGGLTEGCGITDLSKVEALQLWARTADSDLYIAEALLGSALAPGQSLQVSIGGDRFVLVGHLFADHLMHAEVDLIGSCFCSRTT